jgi:hypothetical protein
MRRVAVGLVLLALAVVVFAGAGEHRGFFTPEEFARIDTALTLLNMTREDTRFDKLTGIEEYRRFRLPTVDLTLEDPLLAAGVAAEWAEAAKGSPEEILAKAIREIGPVLAGSGPELTAEESARLRAWARRILISDGEEDETDNVVFLELAKRYRGRFTFPEFGSAVFAGTGDDVHDLRKDPPRLLIDRGGNDRYIAPARGTPEHPVCIVIDLSGDDRYGDGEDLSCGVGFFGTGILIDRGDGDDVYRSGHMSQGCGVFGVGILVDEGGNDVYECRDTGQGAGAWGVGLLLDRGKGNDRFHADLFGQGFAYVGGIGLLHNEQGQDVYEAGGVHRHYPLFNDRFQSLSQGFSIGMRPDASGGLAFLVDDEGNDRYLCDIYGQGASYWFAYGALVDGDGNDTYNLGQYGQGGGIHLATGVLLDLAGQDLYYNMHGVGTGGAHDFAVGILVDRAGDDYYAGSGGTMGGSLTNSFALLLDGGGTDGYSAAKVNHAVGGGRSARGMGSIGLFIDAGGKDIIGTRERNGTSWVKETYGAGIDFADPPPPTGKRPPRRPHLTPEEALARVRERAWDEERKAFDVDRLWKVAKEWAVGEMADVVPVALAKLAEAGEPAMEKALSEVGTKDGLEYRAVQLTLKEFGKKAVPRLVAMLTHEDPRWRRQAAGLLADLGAKEAVPAIEPLLSDEQTSRAALDAIARLDAKDRAEAVTDLLLDGRTGERTRVAAIRCLQTLAVPETIPAILDLMVADVPFTVRFAAEDVLVTFGESAAPFLVGALETSKQSVRARRHAIRALIRIGTPAARESAAEFADHPDWTLRFEAVPALSPEQWKARGPTEKNPHVRSRIESLLR